MLFNYAERKGSKVVQISGNYHERLNQAIDAVDELLAQPMSLK